MKKALVIALAVVLTMALAVPAFAADTKSPTAPVANEEATSPLPVVAENGDKVKLVSVEDADELPEEAQETFTKAQEELKEAAPEGMTTRYFFYYVAETEEETEEETELVLEVKDFDEIVVMQFVDDEWVELEVVENDDGTITIKKVVDGPIAIFTK